MLNKTILNLCITTALISGVSATHADNLLSGLFGSKTEISLNTMLSYVPADTSYLVANKKPMPEDVIEFQLQRIQKIMELMPTNKNNTEVIQQTTNKKQDEPNKNDKQKAFVDALFSEFNEKLKAKKLTDTGLSLKSNNVLYGFNSMPVIRLGIVDKDALLATLKRAEKKSDYSMSLTKCEELDCFINTDGNTTVALLILKNHLALSVFSSEKKEQMIKHLSGKSLPKKSYSEKDWDLFLSNNKFSGYGDGYINLKMLFKKNQTQILEGITKSSKKTSDLKNTKGCLAVIEEHIENMPKILFGTKSLEKNKMDYQVVLKTSTEVSTVLKSIANKSNIAKRSNKPILDIGININFTNLGKALTQYTNFLASSGEKNKCKEIDPMKIRKSMGGMMMAMNMGLGQLNSVYFALDEVELDDKMQPKKLNAFASIGTDDPSRLIAMLTMVNPAFASLKVPADGSPIKIPKELIPSKGKPIPPLSLSRSKNTLNIMLGNDKPDLTDYKTNKPEILSMGMDGKRYYQVIGNIMKTLPVSKDGQADQKDIIEMLSSMSNFSGKFQEEVYADERGLVIDYHVQYE